MSTIDQALKHHQAGNLQQAEHIYRQILQINPQNADALHLLGVLAHQVGRNDVAIDYMNQAITSTPSNPAYRSDIGVAYQALGKPDQAIASFQEAIQLKPDYAEAYHNLGVALREQGKLEEAVDTFRRALQLQPTYAQAHNNLGIAFQVQSLPTSAGIACTENAQRRRKLNEAIQCFQRAILHRSDYVEAYNNLGTAYKAQNKLEKAMESFQQALRINPNHAEANFNRSLVMLLRGDFERGWQGYEWRWKSKASLPREFRQPLWDGSPLAEKTILLHAEQGLGDTLQFIRYALLVKQRGGTVIVECDNSLMRLFRSCPGIDLLVAERSSLPPFDLHAPLMNLPCILKTRLNTIPASIPYLHAGDESDSPLNAILKTHNGKRRIGIVWAGNPKHQNDANRSCPLIHFQLLTEVEDVALFSLQKAEERTKLTLESNGLNQVINLSPFLSDFADTAAAIMKLELVITVDTAVAHLAGALGRPVWVLLPFAPDWRWFLDREDSPWYPTMRLFRQPRPEDWESVFERIVLVLKSEK